MIITLKIIPIIIFLIDNIKIKSQFNLIYLLNLLRGRTGEWNLDDIHKN